MARQDVKKLLDTVQLDHSNHGRLSDIGRLVYPVISRRSGGLSLGLNLNPDKRCSFNCVYCQVDRTAKPALCDISLPQISGELDEWLTFITSKDIELKDISIAGDGEPTHVKILPDVVESLIQKKAQYQLDETRLVLLTNGVNIRRNDMAAIWDSFFQNQGDVWFKLDFWDEISFKRISRTDIRAEKILDNLINFGGKYEVTIQSCLFQWPNQSYSPDIYKDYITQTQRLLDAGVKIKKIQLYTIARKPFERVYPWPDEVMDDISRIIAGKLSVNTEVYYEKTE